MRTPNYDKCPSIRIPVSPDACVAGWEAIAGKLRLALANRGARTVLTVECYTGVLAAEVGEALTALLRPALAIDSEVAFKSEAQVDAMVEPFLGGDDPVFGFLSGLTLPAFFDDAKLEHLKAGVAAQKEGLILIVGIGAALVHPGDILVYADLARWEGQLRQRRSEVPNLGVSNHGFKASLQYKRAYFIDWRVCDRFKRSLLARADFVLDTNYTYDRLPKLADGAAVRAGLAEAARQPFRVVPFFDPAPWGGQWMKEVFDLDPSKPNYGWCFDCVPEENSLLLSFGEGPEAIANFEIPSLNLVHSHPRELLGDPVHARFGAEFPIRFDFLDTIGGGHLSFQVHPLTEYIQQHFGMHYTQDESYYMLDAVDGACVYLGLKPGVDAARMIEDLEQSQRPLDDGYQPFDADLYSNRFPAKKHDHFLIPAGTVHCSGAGSMVLEISATPYIFTFKLWDWNRLGLDGKPRHCHIGHGQQAIQWDRDTEWTRKQLVNAVEVVAQGEGWLEERTGLHEREFIETRRHWFTGMVTHDTGGILKGSVHVLNLVEGEEAIVESPGHAFAPFVVHYAETFIIPAQVGPYTIRPHGPSAGNKCATMLAYVRH
ncbi:class I mannose-6-phosphate isomerase [Luteolibacter arcticus]|uniref:Class I mannose-6-phosphate isomerase n=1 Tax=Luteolibacter arcticus TaxID=1581411 RepID=A0ABT3GK27_9BACT|nr:class I mannose-6-phosphate isomerase [Luteolibacter arcticus]MCW1923851.1 class I mannose-6-phosphate isomerase [Luteolibacter arcticus]